MFTVNTLFVLYTKIGKSFDVNCKVDVLVSEVLFTLDQLMFVIFILPFGFTKIDWYTTDWMQVFIDGAVNYGETGRKA